MKAILIIDNDQDFLDSFAQLLTIRGFIVYKAATIEDARSILRTNFVHMATVDIRMKDDRDDIDILGIRFIQEPEFRYIPKVILTNHPEADTVRSSLIKNLSGFVPAVDYIKKSGGVKMVDQVCEVFDKHATTNEDLKFNWHNGGNFPGLIGFLQPEIPPELHPGHHHELVYLFQKLFPDCLEVNILKRLWDRNGLVALSIHAIKPTREEYFIMTCGDPVMIEHEKVKFDLYGPDPDSLARTRFIRSCRTTHFHANLWKLFEAPYLGLHSLSEDLQKRQEKNIKEVVMKIFDDSLKDWREIKPAVIETSNLNRWQKDILPDCWIPDIEDFCVRIQKVAHECMAKRTINNLTLDSDGIRLTFINHTFIDLPNPLAYLYGEKLLPVQQTIIQNAPGRIHPDTILIDPAGNNWITDFSAAGDYSIWQPYAFLESELLFRFIDTSNFLNVYDLHKSLLLNRPLNTFTQLPSAAPENKRIASAVQAIREAAAKNTGNDPLPYATSLFFISASGFCTNDFDASVRKEHNQYLHRLLVMSMISTLFQNSGGIVQNEESSHPPLRLQSETRSVVRGSAEIALTKTEFDIIAYLFENEGKVCSRNDILKEALDYKGPIKDQDTNMLNTNISRIREKVELTKEAKYILTIHRLGYRLVTNPSENPGS
jgi:DNA-binding response OmpR family regulator